MLGLLITTILSAQPSDSSKVWIDRADALRVLAKAKEADLLRVQLAAKQSDINDLSARIQVKERIISELNTMDEANQQIIASLKKEIEEMNGIRTLQEQEYKFIKKQLKKQKRKTFWVGIAGIVATIGTVFILK